MDPAYGNKAHIRRRIYFIVFAALFILLIPVVVLYADGYRVNRQWQVVATGGIALSDVPDGAQVFINYKQVRSSAFFNNVFYINNLVPDDYFIVVARQGYWSWAKHVTVAAKKVTYADPLNVPRSPKLDPITQTVAENDSVAGFDFFDSTTTDVHNPQYDRVSALFSVPPADATGTAAILENDMKVSYKGTQITAQWLGDPSNEPNFFCGVDDALAVSTSTKRTSKPITAACASNVALFTAQQTVKAVDFLPNRSDAVLFTTDQGLYAVEADRRQVQNIEPIYLAKNIAFRVDPSGTVYVSEAGNFYQVGF